MEALIALMIATTVGLWIINIAEFLGDDDDDDDNDCGGGYRYQLAPVFITLPVYIDDRFER